MGGAKNAMMQHQELLALATQYLVKKAVLEECENHGDVYKGSVALDKDFWPLAMADKNRGAVGPVAWAEKLKVREYTDLLTEARDSHSRDGCRFCAKSGKDNYFTIVARSLRGRFFGS